MKWLKKLKNRWGVSSGEVVIILIVFACTGFTVMFLKEPLLDLMVAEGERTFWFSLAYYLFILPIYNLILLFYGFIFGQFRFFWNFEKRMLSRFKKMGASSKKKIN